ncbi:MAG: phosphoribosylglycinamide formyltransferase [Gammaproteobacteria bacterium]|nr:phosphoribosylglycinamide formyltransferase [Gammaproteobacteria bacterium]
MSLPPASSFSLVVLISGEGSNLQAIRDHIAAGELPAQIAAVISNRSQAPGLLRAQQAGITTQVLEKNLYPDPNAYDRALLAIIDQYRPALVVLAGFMRILTDDFVRHYSGRLINIHPSLLPKYKGLHTHQRALQAADSEHGASVHFVTPELDSGPVILQAKVPILPGDDAEKLRQRVQQVEHRLYPEALRLLATGRVQLLGATVYLDGQPLLRPPVST